MCALRHLVQGFLFLCGPRVLAQTLHVAQKELICACCIDQHLSAQAGWSGSRAERLARTRTAATPATAAGTQRRAALTLTSCFFSAFTDYCMLCIAK